MANASTMLILDLLEDDFENREALLQMGVNPRTFQRDRDTKELTASSEENDSPLERASFLDLIGAFITTEY